MIGHDFDTAEYEIVGALLEELNLTGWNTNGVIRSAIVSIPSSCICTTTLAVRCEVLFIRISLYFSRSQGIGCISIGEDFNLRDIILIVEVSGPISKHFRISSLDIFSRIRNLGAIAIIIGVVFPGISFL